MSNKIQEKNAKAKDKSAQVSFSAQELQKQIKALNTTEENSKNLAKMLAEFKPLLP